MTDLAGKAAIVTGASRNLGRGFAEMLGKRGASVLVHYHTDESRPDAETTASLVRRAGGKAEPIQADFTDANAVESLPKHCLSHFGRFDILINGAAQIIKKSFQEISGQEFDRLFAINTKAPFLLMRAAAMHMGSGGRIVNIGTSVLACSFPFYSIYAGSKAPLEQFTRALAKEVGPSSPGSEARIRSEVISSSIACRSAYRRSTASVRLRSLISKGTRLSSCSDMASNPPLRDQRPRRGSSTCRSGRRYCAEFPPCNRRQKP
jgi:NAD(P)-dependent dehydrogenase (short-subunit alcohol dehydrogenase family)